MVMAYIVMAYIVMAYVVTAHMVMACGVYGYGLLTVDELLRARERRDSRCPPMRALALAAVL